MSLKLTEFKTLLKVLAFYLTPFMSSIKITLLIRIPHFYL